MTSYYSTSICHSESGKCRNEGKKYKNVNVSRTKRAFFDEIKNIFQSF